MILVEKISKNKLLGCDWGIYELSKEQAIRYGGKFALSQGIFSEFALKEIGEEKLLSKLDSFNYEGFFQTRLEAFYQVKLVEMQSKIDRFEGLIKEFTEICDIKTDNWCGK